MTNHHQTEFDQVDEATLTRWLHQWVQAHGGVTMRDTGARLVAECYCGKALGPSYGPTDVGSDKAEALAYFQHQAADLIAALPDLGYPPGDPEDSCCTCGDPVTGTVCHHVTPPAGGGPR